MKVVILNLRSEAIGDILASVTVITSKTTKELESFTNMVFSILISSSSQGYKRTEDDLYIIANYAKKTLNLTDNDLIVVKPEKIERFY